MLLDVLEVLREDLEAQRLLFSRGVVPLEVLDEVVKGLAHVLKALKTSTSRLEGARSPSKTAGFQVKTFVPNPFWS